MPNGAVVPPPTPWFKSSQMRAAIALFVPLIYQSLSKIPAIHAILVNMGISSDQIGEAIIWFLSICNAIAGYWWAKKRVEAGNNPLSPAPAIETPSVVKAAIRITGGTPTV